MNFNLFIPTILITVFLPCQAFAWWNTPKKPVCQTRKELTSKVSTQRESNEQNSRTRKTRRDKKQRQNIKKCKPNHGSRFRTR